MSQVEKIYTEDLRKGILPSKIKGRGANNIDSMEIEERYSGKSGEFESLSNNENGDGNMEFGKPLKSIEGYIIFISNIQEEVQEPDLIDIFSEYGQVKNIHLNIDRRTGFIKGYALIEYENKSEAEEAIKNGNGIELAGNKLHVDYAFITGNTSLPTPVFKTKRFENNNSNNNRSNKKTNERRF